MPKKKNKKMFTKLERFLYKMCTVITVFLIVGIVCSSVSLSQINLEVQRLNDKVSLQEDTNQSLAMKINEMASLESIKEVSSSLGLAYNNDNIKTISE